MIERWLPVVGFEGIYEVSDRGRVKRVVGGRGARAGAILRPVITNVGYYTVSLFRDGKRKQPTIHSLVMASFVGPREKGMFINHKDHVRTNNDIDNLEYASPSENSIGVPKKMTIEQARSLVLDLPNMIGADIARKYGVSQALVCSIRKGRVWTGLTGFVDIKKGRTTPAPK